MVDLDNLQVSLTKNGYYLKVATIVLAHPSNEMLDHVYGSHPGVNLIASQVAKVLCADPTTNVVPGFWDEVRRHDPATVRAFTFVAVIFSHYRLIELFLSAGQGSPNGTISRSDFPTEKEYTNLAFALPQLGASPYIRGAGEVTYDLTSVTNQLADVGGLMARLFRAKLRRCGWRDPEEFVVGADLPLVEECQAQRFHQVLGLTTQEFSDWLDYRPRQPR